MFIFMRCPILQGSKKIRFFFFGVQNLTNIPSELGKILDSGDGRRWEVRNPSGTPKKTKTGPAFFKSTKKTRKKNNNMWLFCGTLSPESSAAEEGVDFSFLAPTTRCFISRCELSSAMLLRFLCCRAHGNGDGGKTETNSQHTPKRGVVLSILQYTPVHCKSQIMYTKGHHRFLEGNHRLWKKITVVES